jgi:hypothetical protein
MLVIGQTNKKMGNEYGKGEGRRRQRHERLYNR